MDMTLRVRSGKFTSHVTAQLEVLNKNTLQIRFPYHPQLIDEIKQFKGRRYIDQTEGGPAWNFTDCERNTYALKYLRGWRPEHKEIEHIYTETPWPELYGHQCEALEFIMQRRRCMIAYEMGLGKTLIGIRAMELAAEQGFYYWWLVAPYGAQKEWHRQMIRWKAQCPPSVISTYESLHHRMDNIDKIPHGVIFDESIKIKNPNAQRSQIAAELSRIVRESNCQSFVITFSGAPAPKDPTDWWHQVEILQPGFIREGSIHQFRNRYANIEYEVGEFGKYPVIKSWKKDEVAKLGKRLAPIVMVRKKKDCLELPDKIFETIQCEQIEQDVRAINLIISNASTAIEALTWLRELSDGFIYNAGYNLDQTPKNESRRWKNREVTWIGSPKLDVISELLDFYHTDNGGPGRLVIYAAFIATIDKLEEYVKDKGWDVARIDGRGWSDEGFLDNFASPWGVSFDNLCLVANPACVHGLSLQQTFAFIYYSNSFSVDHRIQSLDRRDRPGMDTSKGTRIIDLINLPVDQLILDRLNEGIGLQDITLEEIKRCIGI